MERRLCLALAIVAVLSSPAIADEEPVRRLEPGDHTRRLEVEGRERKYLIHVPASYDDAKPMPVVLALHGALMNGGMMVWFTGLNKKSDDAGFIVVYPDGTGRDPFLTWNAGGFGDRGRKPDDVAFIAALLDDLATVAAVDPKRMYACGMSSGGMMCYRLAAELSDRIAAIAPVAGTVAIAESKPGRPVPVMHFHGRDDTIVPYTSTNRWLKGVEESVALWVKLNGCDAAPNEETISKEGDAMKVIRRTWLGCKQEAEVVLIAIDGAGHTWPGQRPPIGLIGKSAMNISANDLMWEFFEKHPIP